jgi:integrase
MTIDLICYRSDQRKLDRRAVLHFGPTKTHQARTVTLPRFLRTMLNRHLQGVPADPGALVFTAPGGGPLRLTNFRRRVWVPALRAAKLSERVRIHDLRHKCASLLIAQGEHPKAIQEQLGHSSIQVTIDRYGHLFPDQGAPGRSPRIHVPGGSEGPAGEIKSSSPC